MNLKINTRDFGEIEVDRDSVVEMSSPILGFEEYRTYALLSEDENGLAWLQSTEEPSLCFVLFSTVVFEDYEPDFTDTPASGIDEDGRKVFVIATVPKDVKKATVNLKSPLVINCKTHCAAQVVLEQDFPVRFPLYSEAE